MPCVGSGPVLGCHCLGGWPGSRGGGWKVGQRDEDEKDDRGGHNRWWCLTTENLAYERNLRIDGEHLSGLTKKLKSAARTLPVEEIGRNRTSEVGPQMREATESWKGGGVSLKLLRLSFSRLRVDENAPSLPSRSLKRGRGRGFPSKASSREESNSVSNHRGRGGLRSREKEGKALVKANLVTKQKSRFRPRTSGSSVLAASQARQRTNNQLNLAGESEETIEPEKPVRAEKLKSSR